ncbi:MAG: SdrD B-like domain-containing protein [Ferruginibacter sp.]
MRKYFTIYCLILTGTVFLSNKIYAQSFIEFSKTSGSNQGNIAEVMQVVNGETYVVYSSLDYAFNYANNFRKIIKYATDGSVVYTTNISLDSSYSYSLIKVVNGEVIVVLLGYTCAIVKLNTTGDIAFSRILTSTYLNEGTDIPILGDEILLCGSTVPGDFFPLTMGGVTASPDTYINFLAKMKISDGSITQGKYLDFNPGTNPMIENNALFYASFPNDSAVFNLPVTMGSIPSALPVNYGGYIYVRKINLTDFSTVYARFVSESAETYRGSLNVHNGQVYLHGITRSPNLYVTNGSSLSPGLNAQDGFYTKLNTDGTIAFSTYLSIPGYDYRPISLDTVSVDASTGNVYAMGTVSNNVDPTDNSLVIYKFSAAGSLMYFKRYSLDWPQLYNYYGVPRVVNDELYLAFGGMASGCPATDGTYYTGMASVYCIHFNPSGNIIYSGYLGRSLLMDFKVLNNKMYISSYTPYPADYLSTDGSLPMGLDDNLVIVLNTQGTRLYRGYTGGSSDDDMQNIQVDNGSIYINGTTWSTNYPVTENILLQGEADYYLTKISFCPDGYAISNDTLFPKTQTVCKYGVAALIKGRDIILPGDSLPPIYRNGVASLQPSIEGTTYQWQKADALAGPWTDIPYATSKNYLPVIADADQYYCRRAFMPASCGSAFIHTSDTAIVLVNALTAPTINAGGTFVTCPGSPVIIGGSPTATGGNPPYTSYTWDQGLAAIANPTVSPLNNIIYTLSVTDAAGCTQIDQAVVVTYKADAGSDKSNCAGSPVRIGNPPIAGVPGVVYSWQPATDLTSTTVAQPFANPPVQTEYDLTLTIPKSGGGTCITYDTMKVTPIAAPLTANFAGPDKTTCADNAVQLGMPAEAGFSYTWTLSNFLSPQNGSYTTYSAYSVNHEFPGNTPREFQVTAYKNGCSFSDRVVVTTIISNAGFDYCGPRLIGAPDITPNINETYSWVKVSGPGNFTGATNLPQVPVTASVGDSTIYGLTVSYNGVNCYDEVKVPVDCQSDGCLIFLNIKAPYVCPDYSVNNGHVTLSVSATIPNAVYAWTPQEGLSTYNGNTVSLTDDVPRTYIVTVTNALDTSMHCSRAIPVNDLSYVLPEFPAHDTITCSNVPVMIGLPSLPGYTYSWGGTGLSNDTISNPVATTFASQYYDFAVGNGTGCILPGTVLVDVQDIPANAGEDRQVCSNAIITLGTEQIPNTTYLWEPQTAPWQNGTNEFSVQPDVLVATTVTYTLTTTSSAGCISTDEMNITVNDSPTIPDAANVISCLNVGTYIGSPAITGVSYQWFPATGLSDPTASQPFAAPPVTTTYTVTANFPGACSLPATDQVTVTVKDISFHMPDIHFCPSDGAVALGTNAPVSPGLGSYFWQPDNYITGQYTVNAFADPPPNISTVFNLTVYSSDGCNYTDTFSLIPAIERPLAGADKTICKDQSTNIGSSSNTTGASLSYNWSPVTDLDDPASPNPVFTGTTTGTFEYVLTKTDNSIPCSVTDTVLITVVDIVPALSSPTICRNSCVQIGTSSVAGIDYQWSPAIGLSDAYIPNPIACIDTVSITYTLTVNDQSGCITNTSVVIGVNGVPGVQVSVPDIVACVGDNNVTLVPSVAAGSYSYLWSPDDGTLSNINITNPIVQTTSPGTTQYTLQITDNITGCTNTVPANVQVNICSPYGEAGNLMWFDTNENGLQDNGELGVSGTLVKLYNNVGFNVATTVTDANGAYSFASILPGNDYYIIFSKPAGYEFTTQNVGGITASDNSKADATGRTNNFNLITGDDISNMDAGIKPGQIVPVTLLSFTAMLQSNKTVLLNWQTTAEISNDFFDVERSVDGINFNTIGRVDGNGTTSLPHNYSLIDPHPLNGINYYRLRQVDFDGHFAWSHVEAVELKNTNEAVIAWYNNQSNSIQLLFNKNQNNLQVKLYSANGQLIKSANATNNIASYTLNLQTLATGVYMLQVLTDKLQYSKKIFISK